MINYIKWRNTIKIFTSTVLNCSWQIQKLSHSTNVPIFSSFVFLFLFSGPGPSLSRTSLWQDNAMRKLWPVRRKQGWREVSGKACDTDFSSFLILPLLHWKGGMMARPSCHHEEKAKKLVDNQPATSSYWFSMREKKITDLVKVCQLAFVTCSC